MPSPPPPRLPGQPAGRRQAPFSRWDCVLRGPHSSSTCNVLQGADSTRGQSQRISRRRARRVPSAASLRPAAVDGTLSSRKPVAAASRPRRTFISSLLWDANLTSPAPLLLYPTSQTTQTQTKRGRTSSMRMDIGRSAALDASLLRFPTFPNGACVVNIIGELHTLMAADAASR